MRQFIALFLSLSLFTGCQDLTEVNIDPAQVSDVPPSFILPAALADAYFHEGMNTNRVAGILMNYFTGTDGCSLVEGYTITPNEFDFYWQNIYTELGTKCQTLEEMGMDKNAPFYTGLGKILKANMYGQLTSFFGRIPFNEALLGKDARQPAFDRQELIYEGIQILLDAAIQELEKENSGYIGGDLVYNGDAGAWIKVAHGLKARYYLQTEKRNPEALTLAQNHLTLSFQSLSEEPVFTFEDSENANWALAKFGQARPGTLKIDPQFYLRLSANNDPRIARYAGENLGGGEYAYYEEGNPNLYWAQNDSKIPLMTLTELKFIEAEITLKQGGNPQAALEEAIRANMNTLSIVEAEANAYVSERADLTGMNADQRLERIMEEAYASYFGNNFHETYANYRRTGYPEIEFHRVGFNPFNPTASFPQRFTYPLTARQLNSENVQQAIYIQGGDVTDLPLWVFQD